ncbi:hypothetical protein HN876_03605 [archaeon]|nr:hypothetical protein [archaeon]MBT6182574.1 hypothetical protein [archaeon]MBT6606826.1 hypothetical protein [archaeon]MBT7251972.1 hypothetical protein [archaeon]
MKDSRSTKIAEPLLDLIAYTRLFPKDSVDELWEWYPWVAEEFFKRDDPRTMYDASKAEIGKHDRYLLGKFKGKELSANERRIRQRTIEIGSELYPDSSEMEGIFREKGLDVYVLSEYGGDMSLLETFLGRSFRTICEENDVRRKKYSSGGLYDSAEKDS